MCFSKFAWRRGGVNYHAALGLPGAVTYWSTLIETFSGFVVVFGCFVVFVLELLAPAMFTTPVHVLPLVALAAPFGLVLWPSDRPPLFFWGLDGSAAARRFLAKEVGATVAFGQPTFLRTVIADVLCSMPKLLGDLAFR
jgi:hypothetical protein